MSEQPKVTTEDSLVPKARPVIAVIVAVTLSGMAIGQAIGEAPFLPNWFLTAYVVGGFVDVLGWQTSREIAKRKGAI